jgi:hypothetical protein
MEMEENFKIELVCGIFSDINWTVIEINHQLSPNENQF